VVALIRPEATGYGATYFAEEMLNAKGDSLKVKLLLFQVQVMLLNLQLKK
jgi:glutamate dehydrogenase/leucine dehydrogenase